MLLGRENADSSPAMASSTVTVRIARPKRSTNDDRLIA